MKYITKIAYIALFLILVGEKINAQSINRSAKKTEHLIALTNAKVVDACVKLIVRDTTENRDFGAFSGAIVSQDGLILTAAHSVNTGHRYRAEFPNGKKAVAIALGKISIEDAGQQFDLAMLKIEGNTSWPFAIMADSRNMIKGEGCVAISYPGSFFQTKPNLRFGIITRLSTPDGFIESSCKMEPGDSGGGLFDLTGKLIGIRDKIDLNEDVNYDIPINLFRQYWTALSKPATYLKLPQSDPLPPLKSEAPPMVTLPSGFPLQNKSIFKQVTRLYSMRNNSQDSILASAIRLEDNGKSSLLWLSKSSMVNEKPWIISNGKKINLHIVGRDNENDLVLLKDYDNAARFQGINLSHKQYFNSIKDSLGKFLFSPVENQSIKIGIKSTSMIELPLLFSKALLGALIQEEDGKLIVKDIAQSYPAESVLKIGDQILTVNEKKISGLTQYSSAIKGLIIGDHLRLGILREGMPLNVVLEFPERWMHYYASHYQGGRSHRSDGFKKVFVQDAAVRSDQCGGPVYDTDGNVIGINIARHSRTATIILPVDVIIESIKGMMKS